MFLLSKLVDLAHITIEVEDSGIGIPASELDKIFAMYYQVKSGEDNLHAVGTGIGLAVSKQLINMMKGDIQVSSEEGFGSTFVISIEAPLSKVVAKDELLKSPELNIFMVEDIELNITVARSLLESMGHMVSVAMSGSEAIEMFDPEIYDLVFLDIQLPDMTGFDIAHYFRKHYATLPPLIALTANVLKNKQEYLEKGMDDAISKPLSVVAVEEVIANFTTGGLNKSFANLSVIDDAECADIYRRILDVDMLEAYVNIAGVEPMKESIKMFEGMMPDYLKILDSNMVAKHQDGIVSEAHKIKGAAGSIGLKHIQLVANKAQSPNLPAWWENINDWVEEIKNEYDNDIAILRQWLAQQSKEKMMIRLMTITWILFLTTSCTNAPSAWHHDNRADQTYIVMESSLRLDKMPNSVENWAIPTMVH